MKRILAIAASVVISAMGCTSGKAAGTDGMTTPPYLKRGDKVAVCLASSSVSANKVKRGVDVLKSWGLEVVVASNVYENDHTYAGTVEERALELQRMIDDPSVKAIVMARGGYGASHIIDKVDFTRGGAKWIAGFSDVTAVLCALNSVGIEGLHSPVLTTIDYDAVSTEYMRQALFGEYRGFEFPTDAASDRGIVTGRLVGGNLCIIASEIGTPYEYDLDGAVLFFEEVEEATYRIDRMLTQLDLTGKLKGVKGILIGELTDCPTKGNFTIEEMSARVFKKYGIPVIYGAPCGHDTKNYPLYIGRQVTIEVNDAVTKVIF